VQIESRRARAAAPAVPNGDPVFFAAGSAARGEYRCAECGYGIAVRAVLPECPMCRGIEWEEPTTSPYGRRTL
jgi:rubrerythrin